MRVFLIALCVALAAPAAFAQFKDAPVESGPKFGRETTQRIRCGIIVSANGGPVYNISATAPVPTDWPEQRVKIVTEDLSAHVKNFEYHAIKIGGGLRQMIVNIPELPAGQEARALVTFEVTRSAILPPADPKALHAPKKPDRTLTPSLGASPYIETRHPKIVAAAKEAVADKETDWEKAEAIYDWVRDRVSYEKGELKGAARALFDRKGDTDELVSLFVGMCRRRRFRPARCSCSAMPTPSSIWRTKTARGNGFPAGQRVSGRLGRSTTRTRFCKRGTTSRIRKTPASDGDTSAST